MLKSLWIVITYFIILVSTGQNVSFDYSRSNNKEKFCLIDENGKKITKFIYDEIDYLKNGFYLVQAENKFGIIDYKGRTTVEMIYDDRDFLNDPKIEKVLERKSLNESEYKRRYDHTWRAFSLNYGSANFNKNKFIEYFENTNACDFGKSLNYLTLEFGGPSNWNDDYAIQLKYFMPVDCPVNPSLYLSGFQINMFQGINLVYVKDFDLPVSLGYGYGNIYFNNGTETFRNPNLSLGLRLNPRFIYKRLLIYASADGWWDLSKSEWKGKQDASMPGFKNTYMGFQLGVGFLLFDYKSGYIRIYK